MNVLHAPVLFIGDRPSSKNLSQVIPFVGTKSYKVLLDWIYQMDLEIGNIQMMNAYTADGTCTIPLALDYEDAFMSQFKIVCLGIEAKLAMSQYAPHLQYVCLPHPSGLNRKLNDKKELTKLLQLCRAFIYDEN